MNTKGSFRHGLHGSPTYSSWANMINRCNNPKNKEYNNYGGRGIKVCDEWIAFEGFLKDMGVKPEGLQIDRIDNDGNYEKNNCRWVTQTENLRNNRHVHYITAFGETKAMSAWAEDPRCLVSYTTLRRRINTLDWSVELAITLNRLKPHDYSKGKYE